MFDRDNHLSSLIVGCINFFDVLTDLNCCLKNIHKFCNLVTRTTDKREMLLITQNQWPVHIVVLPYTWANNGQKNNLSLKNICGEIFQCQMLILNPHYSTLLFLLRVKVMKWRCYMPMALNTNQSQVNLLQLFSFLMLRWLALEPLTWFSCIHPIPIAWDYNKSCPMKRKKNWDGSWQANNLWAFFSEKK